MVQFVRHAFPCSFDGDLAGKPRVLVADDDAPVRRGVSLTLRRRGFEVVESENGAELFDAIASFARERVNLAAPAASRLDLVLTDLRMPKFDGLEVLELLADACWDLPVILMSGLCDASVRARAAELGVGCVLDKPFNAEKLVAAVASLVPLPTR
ncbi:MAG TPA: response regulator [Byssovorax sp.]|jgi:CheY-like chemotaxis protein